MKNATVKLIMILALMTLGLSACQKKEEEKPANIAIKVQGPTAFGFLIVGDAMTTKVILTNTTSEFQAGSHNINTPFIVRHSEPSTCGIDNVLANSTCELTIEFAPTAIGNYTAVINFMGESISLKGGGSVSGTVSFDTNAISFSSLEAGSEVNYTVVATNIGATDFWLSDLPDTGQAVIEKGSCDDVILPGSTCNLNVVFTPKYASGAFTHTISLSDNPEAQIVFTGAVTPTNPAGDINIVFTNVMASNSQQLVSTTIVRDPYGNQVEEGTVLAVSVGDVLSLKPSRSTAEVDRVGSVEVGTDGTVSFTVYSTAVGVPQLTPIYVAYPDSDAYGTREITVNP